MNNKSGKTTIKWMPMSRFIVVDFEESSEARRLKSVGLLDPSNLSDKERLDLGLTSKAAEIANTDTETQKTFLVVAVGPETAYVEVGDRVILQGGANGHSITVEGKNYGQFGEYDVLGKFL